MIDLGDCILINIQGHCQIVNMDEFKVVDVFKHRGRVCVIESFEFIGVPIRHNGYVEANIFIPDRYGDMVHNEEITYYDELETSYPYIDEIEGKIFMGFSTHRFRDTEYAMSQEGVRLRTIMLCNEVYGSRIELMKLRIKYLFHKIQLVLSEG